VLSIFTGALSRTGLTKPQKKGGEAWAVKGRNEWWEPVLLAREWDDCRSEVSQTSRISSQENMCIPNGLKWEQNSFCAY
jgi:hypothetical protein